MKFKKIVLILGLIIIFLISGFYGYIRPKYTVPILMYHRIDQGGAHSSLSVSPKNFRRQMQFLSRHNYNLITLAEFTEAKLKKEELPRNSVVLTFDDGYADNFDYAYPVLKEQHLPATIFVIVDAIGEEGYLNYAQVREMASSGLITFGSHTLSGAYLPGKTELQLKREIGGSKRILQGRLNREIDFLCYPIGGFTAPIQEIARKYGYQAACSTNRGLLKSCKNEDLFALKRIKIKDSFPNIFVFWLKVSGYYNLFRRVREPY